jgi:tetratricopeptide (TPR) repeat protein
MMLHQMRESASRELLGGVGNFIEGCLSRAGFECTGTRARYHYFRAQIYYESNNETSEAVEEYDRSLHYCIKRANERLGNSQSDGQQEIERAFAIYCLGKLKLRLGQIDFEMGQLASAKRHAREAGLLLRVSRDPFLPEMANLLSYCIERQESTFYARGWDLVDRMQAVREGLSEHRPFLLKASIEQLITKVYLIGRQPSGTGGRVEALAEAHTELKTLSSEARQLGLPDLQLLALLASARTLLRMGETEKAHGVAGDAHRIAVSGKDKAEVLFVEGKTFVAQAAGAAGSGRVFEERKYCEEALEKFRGALHMNHPSVNFQLACEERIAGLLLKAGQVIEAERLLKRAREHCKHLEDTFLRGRLEALFAEIDQTRYSEFTYGPGFDVDSAKEEVINKYLLNLQRRLGIDLQELLGRFSEFKERAAPLTRDKLRSLMNRKTGASA